MADVTLAVCEVGARIIHGIDQGSMETPYEKLSDLVRQDLIDTAREAFTQMEAARDANPLVMMED